DGATRTVEALKLLSWIPRLACRQVAPPSGLTKKPRPETSAKTSAGLLGDTPRNSIPAGARSSGRQDAPPFAVFIRVMGVTTYATCPEAAAWMMGCPARAP